MERQFGFEIILDHSFDWYCFWESFPNGRPAKEVWTPTTLPPTKAEHVLRVVVGGFMGVGTPERLIDELVRQKKMGLTLICNDAANRNRTGAKIIRPMSLCTFWLGAEVAKRRRAENWRYGIVLTVAVISAIAAVIAAWPVVTSWS